MEKEFIPYEQALELKELGFNEREECLAYYNTNPRHTKPAFDMVKPYEHEFCLPVPLYQHAFRWFRQKYGIMYTVDNNIVGNTFHGSYTKINSDYESDYTDDFATYEEAELECLKRLIELVKNK